ncbi:speckle-type POZ protein [Caerostris extrusa]|uniref:Speckle-type POZ protein n=1 Tax=Caerostris extrusa TaxID=172846 RepID=A0AAV4WXF3_CAEEX|nr:speckle-type POZ protein [Caerostris extrusa]
MPSLTNLSKLMANRALYLPNDILLLRCHYATRYTSEILYDSQIPSSGKEDMKLCGGQEFKSFENVTNSPMTLINDLAGLYEEGILCDVNLKAGGVTFSAHKNVLSARSQEFREMFTYDAKDNAIKDIELPDLYPDTVSKMLKFIYTGTVEDLHECNAVNLYFAADKYKLLSLKSKCSEFLKATLSLSNIVDALELAERYPDDDLKSFVLNYVLNHDEEFVQSNYWESF